MPFFPYVGSNIVKRCQLFLLFVVAECRYYIPTRQGRPAVIWTPLYIVKVNIR